jgi:modulator of FtsH protease HflC
MNTRQLVLVGLAVLAVVLAWQSFYEVRQTEYAIRFRFRDIVGVDSAPGAYAKIPLVDSVQSFDKRVQTREYPVEQFLTGEGKIVKVDFYAKWRIADPAQYYRATGGLSDAAAGRLDEIVKDGLKGTIARRTIQQVVTAERAEFLQDVLTFAARSVKELGIALVDVRVKRIDLPDEVSESVFKRMGQEFRRQAAQLRAEGDEQAYKIKADADRQRTEILADAARDAARTRGEGDAEAADIYAHAYQKNPEFYAFQRSLQAYVRSLGSDRDVLVLAPDGEFFKYLKQPGRGR